MVGPNYYLICEKLPIRSLLLILVLLGLPALAQDFPVEVELVEPETALNYNRWKAPVVLCGVCAGELGRCPCELLVTQDDLPRLFNEVRQRAEKVLGLELPAYAELRCVGRSELRALGGEPVLGLAEPGHIWVAETLTRGDAFAVMAHEAAHLYDFEHRNLEKEKLREGFAEWVAYHLLRVRGDRRRAKRLTQEGSVYGKGLLYLLKLESEQGREEVRALCF